MRTAAREQLDIEKMTGKVVQEVCAELFHLRRRHGLKSDPFALCPLQQTGPLEHREELLGQPPPPAIGNRGLQRFRREPRSTLEPAAKLSECSDHVGGSQFVETIFDLIVVPMPTCLARDRI